MPKRMLILHGHPDPSGKTFCHALADAYAEGAVAASSIVRRIDVGQVDFPLVRTKSDWDLGIDGTPGALRDAQVDLKWAEHLTIIYPLWHGTMPALLKGFLEQVFRPGVALDYSAGRFPRKLLRRCSARIVITMGMPTFAYRWYFGAHSLKSLERNILKFSGIKPIRETLFGMVEAVSPDKRRKWLKQMRDLGRQDATTGDSWIGRLFRPSRTESSRQSHAPHFAARKSSDEINTAVGSK